MSEVSQPNEQLIETIEKWCKTTLLKPESTSYQLREWLRALLEENAGNQQLLGMQKEVIERLGSELQQTREELEEERRIFGALEYANIDNLMELEQVKAERDESQRLLKNELQHAVLMAKENERLMQDLLHHKGESHD